jgi:hypothetical protein
VGIRRVPQLAVERVVSLSVNKLCSHAQQRCTLRGSLLRALSRTHHHPSGTADIDSHRFAGKCHRDMIAQGAIMSPS